MDNYNRKSGYLGRENKKGLVVGDFVITRREILTSISIIAIMILIGILISNKISEYQMDENEIYNKAIKIESADLFKYGMETNVGNAFVYGKLEPVDTVTYPEISGEYMYVEKIKEKHTLHTRTVTKTTGSGKHRHTTTKTKTYWTWDVVGRENIKCKEITFCGVRFKSNKINLPDTNYIDTINESSHIRYKYYGTDTKFKGTIFTNLKDNTISDNTDFYDEKTIEQTIEKIESSCAEIIFWICWIVLIIIVVFGFYYLDNKWLE